MVDMCAAFFMVMSMCLRFKSLGCRRIQQVKYLIDVNLLYQIVQKGVCKCGRPLSTWDLHQVQDLALGLVHGPVLFLAVRSAVLGAAAGGTAQQGQGGFAAVAAEVVCHA